MGRRRGREENEEREGEWLEGRRRMRRGREKNEEREEDEEREGVRNGNASQKESVIIIIIINIVLFTTKGFLIKYFH